MAANGSKRSENSLSTSDCNDSESEQCVRADRLLLVRNEIYGLGTRNESSRIPLYSIFNRILLLFQSSAVFVVCWRKERPDRWQLFHHYYDSIGRRYLDQFLIDCLSGARGEMHESTTELFAPADAFECFKGHLSPICLPLQNCYHLFFVEFLRLPDDKISANNLGDYFALVQDDDYRACAVRRLFECMNGDRSLPLTEFVFGKRGARLEEATRDFLDRHRTVNMNSRGKHGGQLLPDVSEEEVGNVLEGLRSSVVESVLKDVRPSPLIQHAPSGSGIESGLLPFSNLFFVIRVPYDNKEKLRFCGGGHEDPQGIPYTLKYLIPDAQRKRLKAHFHKLASVRGCRHRTSMGTCDLHEVEFPCILDVRPGAWNEEEMGWAWERTVGEYEREGDEEHGIIQLVEQPFGDNYRSIVDVAIALGTVFFAETLSPDGLSRVHTESEEYAQPIALSLDKLRFYATCCVFHQIAEDCDARLMVVPIQVAGTHFACAVSVVRKNDDSDISWLRTFHFYTMILSRVVVRRFRRDVRDYYLRRIQEFLVDRFEKELLRNGSRRIVEENGKISVPVNFRAVLKDTNRFIEILTRRIPYQRVKLGTKPPPNHDECRVALRVRGEEVDLYFSVEDDDYFPRFRAPLDKRHFPGLDEDLVTPGSYMRNRHVLIMLERAVERISHLFNRYLDGIDGIPEKSA